jgi:hypothetical protein
VEDVYGYQLVIGFELGKCIPILPRTDPEAGEIMFESGGKFYLYDLISWELRRTTSPTILDGIITLVKGHYKAKNAVKWKVVSEYGVANMKIQKDECKICDVGFI